MFKNLKIGSKLAVGFGVILGIFIIVASISWMNVNKVSKMSTNLASVYMPEIRFAIGLERVAQDLSSHVTSYFIAENLESLDGIRENLKAMEHSLNEIKEHDKRYELPVLIEAEQQAGKEFKVFTTTFDKNVDLLKILKKSRDDASKLALVYMESAYNFIESQNKMLKQEVSTGLSSEMLTERLGKIELVNNIIDKGNSIRIKIFKSELRKNPQAMVQALSDLKKTDKDLMDLIKIIRRDENKRSIENIRKAKISYRNAINKLVVDWSNLEENKVALNSSLQKIMGNSRSRAIAGVKESEEISVSAAFDLQSTTSVLLVGFMIALLMGVLIAFVIARMITKPIVKMVKTSEKLQANDLSARNNDDRKDELGLLSKSFDNMADNLSSRIKVEANITELVHSTIEPKETEDFAFNLLKKSMEITNSCLGAFYIRTDDNLFVPVFSIGLDEDKKNTFKADSLEGQFGISLASTSITRFDDIPEDTIFTAKTFVGDIVPKNILTIPFDFDGKVEAILTIAAVNRYSEEDMEVLEISLRSLKMAFANVKYNEETERLARKLKVTNTELMEQAHTLEEHAEELEVQKVKIEAQRDRVEEANRFKSSFLSNMSHELRTPLNSILAISRIMSMKSGERLTVEDKKYLKIVERNGKQLLSLINDILELSRIEANRVEVSIKIFDLSKTIKNVVETITPLADDKKISVQVDICEDFPLIENDEDKIRQVIVNIVGNAIKFTDNGTLNITCRVNGGMAALEIKDTGIGISAENKSRIFDEFRQIDGTTSRKYGGTGLGLAIVKKLLHLLGGNVTLDSTLGEGSTFTVLLPVKWGGSARVVPSFEDISFDKEKESNDEIAFDDNSVKDQKLILVVEDNKIAALQVKMLLEEEGYLVDTARNGEEAMEYVQQTIPDGLVLDLMMPGVDGFEVLENIRGTEKTATIPVIILTAKDLTQKDLNKLSANNVQQLIQKGDVNREGLIEKARLAFN